MNKEKQINAIKRSGKLWPGKMFWWRVSMAFTKKPKHDLPIYKNIKEIQDFLNYGKDYVPDPRNGNLDIMRHPTHIMEDVLNKGQVGDCDEHAIYFATNLVKSQLVRRAWLVTYQMVSNTPDQEISGHALCVYQSKEDGFLYWIDYGQPNKINTLWDFAVNSAKLYNAKPIIAKAVEVVSVTKRDRPVLRDYQYHVFE